MSLTPTDKHIVIVTVEVCPVSYVSVLNVYKKAKTKNIARKSW